LEVLKLRARFYRGKKSVVQALARLKAGSVSGRDFGRRRKRWPDSKQGLYQGTTLVVPQAKQ
jgi:hypothetical protein